MQFCFSRKKNVCSVSHLSLSLSDDKVCNSSVVSCRRK